jgi:hypothetical protein
LGGHWESNSVKNSGWHWEKHLGWHSGMRLEQYSE